MIGSAIGAVAILFLIVFGLFGAFARYDMEEGDMGRNPRTHLFESETGEREKPDMIQDLNDGIEHDEEQEYKYEID